MLPAEWFLEPFNKVNNKDLCIISRVSTWFGQLTVRCAGHARVRVCGVVAAVRTVRAVDGVVGCHVGQRGHPRVLQRLGQLLEVIRGTDARNQAAVRRLQQPQLVCAQANYLNSHDMCR